MGFAKNVALSIPIAVIICMLIEKLILSTVADQDYNEKVQTNFIVEFVIGLSLLALAVTAFAEKGIFDNQPIQLSLYGAGGFMVFNSVFLNWDVLDNSTKMMIMLISVVGLIIYAWREKRDTTIMKEHVEKKMKKK